ncbi:MAG: tetratricopeptide repeat protein [Bacteroidetes bacterium]|nr:MAG: tetratricopeptide repeat protein [Bacteroidota bacterium]
MKSVFRNVLLFFGVGMTSFSWSQEVQGEWEELIEQINEVEYRNLDSAIFLGERLTRRTKKQNPYYYAESLRLRARAHLIQGDFKKVSLLVNEAIPIFEQLGNKKQVASCYNLMSILNDKLQRDEENLSYSLKAMGIYQQIKDSKGINMMAGNLFLYYLDHQKMDLAKKYLDIQAKTSPNSEESFFHQNNKGLFYLRKKEYDQAIYYFERAEQIAKKKQMVDAYTTTYIGLGKTYMELKDYGKSEKFLLMARKEAIGQRNLPEHKDALEALEQLYAEMGQKEKLQKVGADLRIVKDSLFNLEKIHFINQLESKIQLQEKQEIINQQENDLLESEVKQQQMNQQILVIVLILTVLVSVSFIVFVGYNRIRKQNRIISDQKQRLEQAHELNQKIFAIVSHDFRGPLNSLEILVDLLGEHHQETGVSNEIIGDIQNQLKQSELVLENLIQYAREELRMADLSKSNIRMKNLCDELILHTGTMVSEKKLEIVNGVDSKLEIESSTEVLRIILRNLLSNAIKYSPEASVIEIKNQGPDEIQIMDRGKGVSDEIREQLFEQSVKSKAGTHLETGFGLGLKLSAELAAKLGARLKYEDREGGGSVFSLIFES